MLQRSWRDASTLIVVCRNGRRASAKRADCNFDVLVQTRTQRASFKNSVVFPGGVVDAADSSPEWISLLKSFGYTQSDFDALHHKDAPPSPLFQNHPVQRHISLRITAIRETFEELGLLICSRANSEDRKELWASNISDIDLKYWQHQVCKNPDNLLTLCKEYNCYPDIWSLHYWSNWLTPVRAPKRFDTAFFLTALKDKPDDLKANSEVAKVEWSSPLEILSKNRESNVILYPPQSYELNRLASWSHIEDLVDFAKKRSPLGNEVLYFSIVQAQDGKLFTFPGDDLYPIDVDLNAVNLTNIDKSIKQLREESKKVHRYEFKGEEVHLVLKNISFNNQDMGEIVIPSNLTIS